MREILLWTSINPIYTSLIIFIVVTLLLLIFVRKQLLKSQDTLILVFSALGLFFIQLLLPSNFREFEPYKDVIRLAISIVPIAISVYLCLKYWKAMEDDFTAGVYGESIYPTLMVSQGTFFTFVGVSAILFSYDTKGNDINMLLTGLKLAFVTSVIGLVFSIAAKRYIKYKTDNYVSANRSLIQKDYLDEKDFFNAIKKFNNDLINMSNITDNIKDNMFVTATASVKANEERAKVFDDFRQIMRDTMAENSKLMENHLVKMQKQMEQNMSLLVEQFQNSIKESFHNMENGITKIDNAYAHLSEQSDIFIEKMAIVGNAEEKLVERLMDYNSEIVEKLDKQSCEIVGRTNKLLNDTEVLTENTNNHFIKNTNLLNQYLKEIIDNFKSAADIAENAHAEYIDKVDKRTAAMNEQFASYLETAVAKITEGINEIKTGHDNVLSEFNKNTVSLSTGLNNTGVKMQENLEKIASTMASVNQYVLTTNKAVEDNEVKITEFQQGYSDILKLLVQQITNIKDGIENLNTSLIAMQNNITNVNTELKSSGESFGISIKDMTDKANGIATVIDRFNTLDSSLKQSNEVVDKLLRTLDSYNAALAGSQDGILQVSNNLAEGQNLITKNSSALDKQLSVFEALINKIDEHAKAIAEDREAVKIVRELTVKEYNDGLNNSLETSASKQ